MEAFVVNVEYKYALGRQWEGRFPGFDNSAAIRWRKMKVYPACVFLTGFLYVFRPNLIKGKIPAA